MSQVIPFYQVDAFSAEGCLGNPAAIMLVEDFPAADLMQQIAEENNLSETAFLVRKDSRRWAIRWFTPATEVGLCGHATLAAAFVLQHAYQLSGSLLFDYASGQLQVDCMADQLALTLPAEALSAVDINEALCEALGVHAEAAYRGSYYMLVLADEAAVRAANPDFSAVRRAWPGGIVITAKGDQVDFVSRFFAPGMGIDEDPVTGSAHCLTVPYWAAELSNNRVTARQLSPRGGYLQCALHDDRVVLQGQCKLVIKGEYYLSVNGEL